MSSKLLRKSLELVDPTINDSRKVQPKQKKSTNQKSQQPADRFLNEVPINRKRLTVIDRKKQMEIERKIAMNNVAKRNQTKNECQVKLEKNILKAIIKRGVTKRPVRIQNDKPKKDNKTVFTEEDFRKFEEEFCASL